MPIGLSSKNRILQTVFSFRKFLASSIWSADSHSCVVSGGVHETVLVAIGIEVFHLMLFESCLVEFVAGSKRPFKLSSVHHILEFCTCKAPAPCPA